MEMIEEEGEAIAEIEVDGRTNTVINDMEDILGTINAGQGGYF